MTGPTISPIIRRSITGWRPAAPPGTASGAGPVAVMRVGLAAIGASVGCFLVTALLGPSPQQPALPGPGPSFTLAIDPSPYLVTALVVAGVLAGTAGLGLCLLAAGRGVRVSPRALLVAGLLATAALSVLPPVGSSDHLNYAAYGRMVVTGHDPYATTAAELAGDPIADAVQEWRRTPSLYGPIATAQEAFAAWAGGGSLRVTVLVLSLTNGAAFALTGVLLYRLAGRGGRSRAGGPAGACAEGRPGAERRPGAEADADARLRAVLLWSCNPLLLFHLVSGAHNDTLAIAVAVAALGAFIWRGSRTGPDERRTRAHARLAATGALTGAAVAIKLPAGLVGGGPAWALLRRRPLPIAALASLFGTAGLIAAGAYALAGPHAFDQVSKASRSVSLATPWHLVDLAVGGDRTVVRIGALILLAVLVWALARALPRTGGVSPEDAERAEAVRISAALVLAWLFAAPYALPWYDGLGYAVLALLPWSRFDWLLLIRTAALSLAYLPARAPELTGLPDRLSWLFTVVRPTVIPLVLTVLLLALVVTSVWPPRPAPAPVRSPRA